MKCVALDATGNTKGVKAGDGVTFHHKGTAWTGLVLKTWRRAAYVRLGSRSADGMRWTVPYTAIVEVYPAPIERRRKA